MYNMTILFFLLFARLHSLNLTLASIRKPPPTNLALTSPIEKPTAVHESSASSRKSIASLAAPAGVARSASTLPSTSRSQLVKDRNKDRSRSKSPFRSFRWKKSPQKTPLSAVSASDDEATVEPTSDQSATEADGEILEGILNRKHEWESTTKKASNRSWDKVFVCVQGSNLAFYKDAKTAKTSPETYFKGEAPIDLHGGTADVATDYTKKKFVLRAKLASGAEFLFQARNEAEMRQWVSTLKNVCEQDAAGTQSRSQTLPAVGDKRDEPKRRSFFTLKKV